MHCSNMFLHLMINSMSLIKEDNLSNLNHNNYPKEGSQVELEPFTTNFMQSKVKYNKINME
jgi:hypothetical protein